MNFTDWRYRASPIDSDWLCHHGIKGQKWGVRRYRNTDGTLTLAGKAHYAKSEGGSRRLSRQYNRATRKLNRLEKRADVNEQAKLASKYKKRAKVSASLAATLATAALGSHVNTVSGNTAEYIKKSKEYNRYLSEAARRRKVASKIDPRDWFHGYNEHLGKLAEADARKMEPALSALGNARSLTTAAMSTTTKVLAGAAAVAAGYSIYSAVRSKIAKKRTTEIGHSKAVAKYKNQVEKTVAKFPNTPYSELLGSHITKPKNQRRR